MATNVKRPIFSRLSCAKYSSERLENIGLL